MTNGNCARVRAPGSVFLCLLLALSAASAERAGAQDDVSSISDISDASAVVAVAGPEDLESALERAEALFQEGETALTEGREASAREALDAALDVFVSMQEPEASDPRSRAAYLSLIGRISAAEIAVGTHRQVVPVPSPAPGAEPAAGEPLQDSTLAELGERIEGVNPSEGARESNEAVLGSELIDLPIELNDQVLSAIDLYSGRFNEWFSKALSRGLPHLPRIREILAEAGIPQDLAYVPIVESAFKPSALSRAKAKGLWQFIPSTGRQYGLRQDFFIDERSDMEKATVAAAQYLKNLYEMFGDWNLALAGYNAGEGRVQRAIKRAKTNDFWALAKTRSFRKETRNYVPLIHAAIVIAKSPESYGIDVLPEVVTASETVSISGSYPIATVARCAGSSAGEIKQLNPQLRRAMTPSFSFDLRVPDGSGARVSECLAGERTFNFARHTIRRGDTLSGIGALFGVSASEIARANGMTLRTLLRPGVELAIPKMVRSSSATTASPGSGSDDPSYRIRKGDTLSGVAARHGTTVAAIKALNGLKSTRLSIGQVLRVVPATDGSLP